MIIKNSENIGLALSLNKGIEIAKYELIARMDADDISLPERFMRQVSFLEENKDVCIVATNKIHIDENDKVISYGGMLPRTFRDTIRAMKYISIICHPSVMFLRSVVKSLDGYRDFPASQDYDLWLRAISEGLNIGFIDEYLIKYRMSPNNTSNRKALKQWVCDKYIKKLYKERLKKGEDSYSSERLNSLFDNYNVDSIRNNENFKKAKDYLDLARVDFQNKKNC